MLSWILSVCVVIGIPVMLFLSHRDRKYTASKIHHLKLIPKKHTYKSPSSYESYVRHLDCFMEQLNADAIEMAVFHLFSCVQYLDELTPDDCAYRDQVILVGEELILSRASNCDNLYTPKYLNERVFK